MNTKTFTQAVAYMRVSTADQGRRGRGLDAQREAIERFAESEGLMVVQWVSEVETGKGADAMERRLISTRTREALAALKRKGVKLGNPSRRALVQAGRKGAAANKEEADTFARSILPHIQGHQQRGLSLRAIAEEFNRSGIRTARGGQWTATQLSMIQRRVA